jgi:hypothetical protein
MAVVIKADGNLVINTTRETLRRASFFNGMEGKEIILDESEDKARQLINVLRNWDNDDEDEHDYLYTKYGIQRHKRFLPRGVSYTLKLSFIESPFWKVVTYLVLFVIFIRFIGGR